jgi:hypothetical protein
MANLMDAEAVQAVVQAAVAAAVQTVKEKSSKGKDYVYCPFHESTKWVLKGNHANGCDNDPQNKDTSAAAGKPPTGKPPDKRTLQYAKALMVAMESAEEGDEEQDPGDEEI